MPIHWLNWKNILNYSTGGVPHLYFPIDNSEQLVAIQDINYRLAAQTKPFGNYAALDEWIRTRA